LIKPVKIKVRDRKSIFIKWNDDSESDISAVYLRKYCPCATCLAEKERKGKSYIPIYNDNQVIISGVAQVGSYAIGISFRDGHNTGIYEYTFLKKLSNLSSASVKAE